MLEAKEQFLDLESCKKVGKTATLKVVGWRRGLGSKGAPWMPLASLL